MKDYKEIANTLASVTNLPTFFVRDNKLEVVNATYLSNTSLTRLKSLLFTKPFGNSTNVKFTKVPQLIRYVNHFNLSFLDVVLETKPITTIVMGPFFLEEKDTEQLIKALLDSDETNFSEQEARALIDSIEVKDSMFIQAWGKVVFSLLEKPYGSYLRINTIKQNTSFQKEVPTIAENRMDEAEISSQYKFEHEIKQLIKQGNKEQLRKKLLPRNDRQLAAARQNPIFQRRVQGPNSLREEKNLILTMNSLFRQSADDAGLPPIYIHSISEDINAKIEKADSSEALLEVIEDMIENYCNSINNVSLQNHSVNVVKVQRYIVNNIDKKISLADLSELTNLDESYLCRLFKRECHMTINEYIQNQRINEAKWMLESSDNSIIDISHLLGFTTQSYFCSVFKKVVGVSPAKYRLNHGNYYKAKS